MLPIITATVTTSTIPDPSPENNYLVYFEDSYGSTGESTCWSNPYAYKAIKPYVPQSLNPDSIQISSNLSVAERCICDINQIDAISNVIFILNPTDLTHFSGASKCCYLASDKFFQIKFKQIYPTINFMPMNLCTFTPKNQCFIIFAKVQAKLKPFIVQLQYCNERLIEIKEEGWQKNRYNTQIERCHLAINSIPLLYNNQETFEFVIQASETAKNNTSLDIEPQVEEVDDADTYAGSYPGSAGSHPGSCAQQ